MATVTGVYLIFIVVVSIFAIGSFVALPWIWYHAGHISRKLSRIVELLEKGTSYDLSDDSVFKGLSREEAIGKWRGNPADKRSYGQIVAVWEKINK